MDIGKLIRQARRRASLSQRELAERTGLPQSTVARVESGFVDPRTSTVVKLLAACGEELEVVPRLGEGVDRTIIRQLLELDHEQRLDNAVASANNLKAFQDSIEWTKPNSTPSALSKR